MDEESKIRVRYPTGRGALRIGDYRPGETYMVHVAEAKRLVEVKGFEYVDACANDADQANEEQ